MSTKENILKKIHENENCPICMNIIEIEEKVYTESCNHVYCILCLGKWCIDNPICPMDRLNLTNVFVYNSVEDDIKMTVITNVIYKYIYSERDNEFKVITEKIIRILSCFVENYNHVMSMSKSMLEIYEIFRKESFQILLNMDPNHSRTEINVFLQSIDSTKSKLFSKLQRLGNTIYSDNKWIQSKIYFTERDMETCLDNLQLITYLKNLKLFNEMYQLLSRINIQVIEYFFWNTPPLNKQNTYNTDKQ